MDHPIARVEEYLEIVRRAMRGEKLDFNGQYFRAHAFKLAFKPGKNPIPIYLVAFGPKMTRLAGQMSDGVLINMANADEIRRIADDVRQGAEKRGRTRFKWRSSARSAVPSLTPTRRLVKR